MMNIINAIWYMPNDIKCKIYEYDDTYKKIMNNNIVKIWKNNWIKYIENIENVYEFITINQIAFGLGVFNMTGDTSQIKENINTHPDNFDFYYYKIDLTGVKVFIFNNSEKIFAGWILTEKEYQYMRNIFNLCCVYYSDDSDLGLYLQY